MNTHHAKILSTTKNKKLNQAGIVQEESHPQIEEEAKPFNDTVGDSKPDRGQFKYKHSKRNSLQLNSLGFTGKKENIYNTLEGIHQTAASSNETKSADPGNCVNYESNFFSVTQGSQTNKSSTVVSNMKFLFETNSERGRKRSQQLKRLKSKRASEFSGEDFTDDREVEKPEEAVANKYKKQHEDNFFIDFESKNKEIQREKVCIPAPVTEKREQEDIEVCISDIDGSIESVEEEAQDTTNIFSLSNSNAQSARSFVPITNSLKTKNILKEDNATESYLLALNDYSGTNINEHEPGFNEDYDSLENTGNPLDKQKSRSTKHIRLPSGKNYLINSVIEEENDEMFTDSEISLKKRSYLFSKHKYSSSGKKFELKTSREISHLVEKDLDSVFFNKMEDSSNKVARAISKSEIPTVEKEENPTHKTAKSEIFNIQFDMSNTLYQLTKKQERLGEKLKSQVVSKKKMLMNKFYNSNHELRGKNLSERYAFEQPKSQEGPSEVEQVNMFSPAKVNIDISFEENTNNAEDSNSNKQPQSVNHFKAIKEKYKKERKKSSIFKSEDLRISKVENVNLLVTPGQNVSMRQKESSSEKYSYININNNINICSPLSINSIVNNNVTRGTIEKKSADKTMMNAFDLVKSNNEEFANGVGEFEVTNPGQQSPKIDLSHIPVETVKRKLFPAANEQPKPNFLSVCSVNKEISFDIINKNLPITQLKEQPSRKKISLNFDSRMQHLNQNKPYKAESMNVNIFNEYHKNMFPSTKKVSGHKAHKAELSTKHNETSGKGVKPRSNSGSLSKYNITYQDTNECKNKSKANVTIRSGIKPNSGTSPDDRAIKKSNSSRVTGIKAKFSKEKPVNTDNKQILTKVPNAQNSKDLHWNNSKPSIPKSNLKVNPPSISRVHEPSQSNKIKILEVLKLLSVHRKGLIYTEHYKVVLEKLMKANKNAQFVIWIEKQLQGATPFNVFKAIFCVNKDKSTISRIYAVEKQTPSKLHLSKKNLIKYDKSLNKRECLSEGLDSECMAFSLIK